MTLLRAFSHFIDYLERLLCPIQPDPGIFGLQQGAMVAVTLLAHTLGFRSFRQKAMTTSKYENKVNVDEGFSCVGIGVVGSGISKLKAKSGSSLSGQAHRSKVIL